MGFRFRKSKKIGPLRYTLSKSGLATSVGVKGFRVTKTASGRVRTTASIPGTGISYVKEASMKTPVPAEKTHNIPIGSAEQKPFKLGFVLFFIAALFVVLACALSPKAAAQTEYTDISQLEDGVTYSKEDMLAIYELGYRNGLRDAKAGGDSLELVARSAAPAEEPVEDTYILNTNTKKFHYPSCKSVKQIKDKNKDTFTGSREDLIARGYTPCGNCKP